ncbi:MAG: metallophosphoesterase [Deltaproteobacteria bacterium]|nr:metallophosphoesterase [Deltaproteobacteria bacterium]MBW1952864.1 metallophosphoesterase [Deltaproteobacteria bacterium]MBW1985862.1 metallophosphoesterase [Deltaproteobacteria bacterium]MBW2133622.1 metallophosphoesterase [Deltaproteobacteria bacterium]
MQRREFLKKLGQGLVAGWLASRLPYLSWGTPPAWAKSPLRLAYLSDAHLVDGQAQRPQARALIRAVTEINALRPLPDLVLFGGDLAHTGHPEALELGRKILSDLKAPRWLLMGEHDGSFGPDQPWAVRFGSPRFSFNCQGFHFLGIHTAWEDGPDGGGGFRVGRAQQQWLAAELARISPSTPLVVCSHAPLYLLYKPWHYWTEDGQEVQDRLSVFTQVTFLHGHVHHELQNRQKNWTFQGMPALGWPGPDVRQGTPAQCPEPQLEVSDWGHAGCGWGLLTLFPEGRIAAVNHLWRV